MIRHLYRKNYFGLLILCAFCIFFGCVSIPKEDLHGKLAPTASLESSISTAYESSDFVPGNWPSPQWWEMFGDPQLDWLIQTALADNPNLKKVDMLFKRAQEIAKEKRASLGPDLGASGDLNWQHLSRRGIYRNFTPTIYPPVLTQIDMALDFQMEFDFWGKNKNIFRAALGEAKAQEAEVAQAKLMITTMVAKTYFDLQLSETNLKILEELYRSKTSLLQLTNARKNAGLDNEIQWLTIAQEVLELERSLEETRTEIVVEMHQLKVLLGKGPDSPETIETPKTLLQTPFPLPKNITVDLLSRRPDLMAQIWRVEAAAHEIGAAKAAFYPNIDLSGFLGLESLALNKIFLRNNFSASFMPAITLPIFTSGRLQAQLGAKTAEFEEASYAYNELLLKAAQEVADQISLFLKVNEQLRIQTAALDAARQKYTLTFFRFTQGVSNYMEVLRAEEELLQQRVIESSLQEGKLSTALQLIRALGGGYHRRD